MTCQSQWRRCGLFAFSPVVDHASSCTDDLRIKNTSLHQWQTPTPLSRLTSNTNTLLNNNNSSNKIWTCNVQLMTTSHFLIYLSNYLISTHFSLNAKLCVISNVLPLTDHDVQSHYTHLCEAITPTRHKHRGTSKASCSISQSFQWRECTLDISLVHT